MMSSGEDRSVDSAKHLLVAKAIAGNKDLLREILLRLPIKSLLRFKSVSKEWLSLISNPHFAQSYTHRYNPNLKPSSLLLNHQSIGFQFVPFIDDGDGDGNKPKVKLSYPDDLAFRRPIYCNGAIHWFSARKTSLYFDTPIERLKKMPMLPFHEGFDFDYNVRYFRESRGHLHIIVTDEPTVVEFDILELKIGYSRWFVRYCVNLDAVMATFEDVTWNFSE
ncbi:hypothetical protein L1049_021259 [Liquidambar formosana]|uniref:F-box domain-containing protein n=1 Tax=Liquidambar formosana TaxID=63359 RepID=A0AAP0SDU4_LIQFO